VLLAEALGIALARFCCRGETANIRPSTSRIRRCQEWTETSQPVDSTHQQHHCRQRVLQCARTERKVLVNIGGAVSLECLQLGHAAYRDRVAYSADESSSDRSITHCALALLCSMSDWTNTCRESNYGAHGDSDDLRTLHISLRLLLQLAGQALCKPALSRLDGRAEFVKVRSACSCTITRSKPHSRRWRQIVDGVRRGRWSS